MSAPQQQCTPQSTLEVVPETQPSHMYIEPRDSSWGTLISSDNLLKHELSGEHAVVIGRAGGGAQIEINDPRISNTHLKIEKEICGQTNQYKVAITDTSTNGTYVNGYRLIKNRQHRLHNGDEIGIVGIQHKKRSMSSNDAKSKCFFSFIFKIPGLPLVVSPKAGRVQAWQLGDLIGKGGYGTVHLGINCQTAELIAIKTISLSIGQDASEVQQEIDLLRRLDHPNIVKYLACGDSNDHKMEVVMEYVPGGSLAQLLERFGRFHESLIITYTSQIVQGLHYLHDCQVIHRDLKAANILVSDNGIAKLSDFGSALSLKHSLPEKDKILCGTPLWVAPEVVKENTVGYHSDVWGLGCTVLEMATGKRPWSEKEFDNPIAVLYHIGNATEPPQLPSSASPELHSFMQDCLQLDPSVRPTCKILRRHLFLKKSASSVCKDLNGQLCLDDSPNKRHKPDVEYDLLTMSGMTDIDPEIPAAEITSFLQSKTAFHNPSIQALRTGKPPGAKTGLTCDFAKLSAED